MGSRRRATEFASRINEFANMTPEQLMADRSGLVTRDMVAAAQKRVKSGNLGADAANAQMDALANRSMQGYGITPEPVGNALATSKSSLYALPGQGGDRQALETERDILTRDLNATTNVTLKNQYAARIEAITAEINKTYYPETKTTATPAQEAGVANFGFKNTSAGTGLPAPKNTYSADLQKIESEIDSLQQNAKKYKGTSAESGYIARIGELAMQVSQMTAQQDPKKSEVYRQLHSDVVTNNTGNSSYIYDDPYDYGDTLDQAYGQGFNSEREFAGAEAQMAKMTEAQKVMAGQLAAIGIATAAIPAIVMSGAGPAALLNPAAYGAGAAAAGVTGAASTAAGGGLVAPGLAGGAGTMEALGTGATLALGGKVAEKVIDSATGKVVDKVVDTAVDKSVDALGNKIVDKAVDKGTSALFGGMDAAAWASLISGLGGAYTANEAGKAQADAARYAADKGYTASQDSLALQKDQYNALMSREKDIYDQQRADTQPWRTAGEQALGSLNNFERDNPVYKADPFKFETTGANADPSYNFRLNEGMKALQASAAAKGMLRSGNTLQGITDYAQGAASQEYSNAFSRYQADTMNKYNMSNSNRGQNLNRLQSLAGVGQTAVGQLGNAGQNYGNSAGQAGQSYANNAGDLMAAGANAQGQGAIGAANGNASGMVGASNSLTNALSGYLQYNSRNNMNRSMYGGY